MIPFFISCSYICLAAGMINDKNAARIGFFLLDLFLGSIIPFSVKPTDGDLLSLHLSISLIINLSISTFLPQYGHKLIPSFIISPDFEQFITLIEVSVDMPYFLISNQIVSLLCL